MKFFGFSAGTTGRIFIQILVCRDDRDERDEYAGYDGRD